MSDREKWIRRFQLLTDLIRQHRCSSDGAMTVGECIDKDRCGCSVGAITVYAEAPAEQVSPGEPAARRRAEWSHLIAAAWLLNRLQDRTHE